MRIAIVHYWLVGMRGGERVLESLCRMFPDADIYTHVYDPAQVSDLINSHRVHTTKISKLPLARKLYQKYLPFMPRALEELDLTGYDLVISSESGPAKGVITNPDAFHLCYCHSPMRYVWDHYHLYRNNAGWLSRLMMPKTMHRLRLWDVTSAARVDGFVANSNFIKRRIRKFWRRDSDVVFPPVAIQEFKPVPPDEVEDYYLWVGELAPYKRPDIAVEAFTRMGKRLLVIGGPEKTAAQLKIGAGPTVEFLGQLPFSELKMHMARCKALIFPGEEDFGIVPVETIASGRHVIALGRGGALDTVIDGKTGILFEDQTTEALIGAVDRYENVKGSLLGTTEMTEFANKFSEIAFQAGIKQILEKYEVGIATDIGNP